MPYDINGIRESLHAIISGMIVARTGPAPTIADDTPLLSSGLGLDSIAVLQLMVKIEDRFGISFDVDELSVDLFDTLGSLVSAVERKVATGQLAETGDLPS